MGNIADKLLALNSAKHAIRQAINDKGGGPLEIGDPLSAYPEAVSSIHTGYDPGDANYCHVVFLDDDGIILQDSYVKRGDAVQRPTVPEHPGAAFLGWNYPDSKLDAVYQDMCVGALYTAEANTIVCRVRTVENGYKSAPVKITASGDAISYSARYGGVEQGTFSNETLSLELPYNSAAGVYELVLYDISGVSSLRIAFNGMNGVTEQNEVLSIISGVEGVEVFFDFGTSYLPPKIDKTFICVGGTSPVKISKFYANRNYVLSQGQNPPFTSGITHLGGDISRYISFGDPEGDYHANLFTFGYNYYSWSSYGSRFLPLSSVPQSSVDNASLYSDSLMLYLESAPSSFPKGWRFSRVFVLGEDSVATTVARKISNARVLMFRPGFVPTGALILYCGLMSAESIQALSDCFGETTSAISISFIYATRDADLDAIAEKLVALGYTVTFSNSIG